MKDVQFRLNPDEKLWINIEMTGIYSVTYTYRLWSAGPPDPPILSNPEKDGNNLSSHDDQYMVINDYVPTESIAKYDKRLIDLRFWVKKLTEDNGYTLTVHVLQGKTYETATEIGSDTIQNTLGTNSLKSEQILIRLIK